MAAEKFFTDNINRLPKIGALGLKAEQAVEANTQWGLLELAKQLTAIQHEQQRQSQELQQLRQLLLQTR